MKKMILIVISALCIFSLTACGKATASYTTSSGKTVTVKGEEGKSGDLGYLLPEGWKVDEKKGDFKKDGEIVFKKKFKKDEKEVSVTVRASNIASIELNYNDKYMQEMAEKNDDNNCIPADYTLGENILTGFRNYQYAGAEAEDWSYYGYTAEDSLLDIHTYNNVIKDKENAKEIRGILSSLTFKDAKITVTKSSDAPKKEKEETSKKTEHKDSAAEEAPAEESKEE